MRHLSLFTGVGGFDLGFEAAGMTTVGQVERDAKCQVVLDSHWPGVARHDDVVSAKEWVKGVGPVDVVSGGFPCQDVSTAGKRAGLAGARTGLFWDALAVAKAAEARWIVLENVPGLLSSNQGRDFGVVLTALADAGFSHVEWRVLDSQFFGVPQRRRRVFIVGCVGAPRGGSVLVESEGGCGDSSSDGSAWEDASVSLEGGPIAFGHTNGLDLQPGRVAPTLRVGGGGAAVLDRQVVRRLTPRECERLQGFPDDWTSVLSDTHRYRQMGNAVSVPVAKWVGERLVAS